MNTSEKYVLLFPSHSSYVLLRGYSVCACSDALEQSLEICREGHFGSVGDGFPIGMSPTLGTALPAAPAAPQSTKVTASNSRFQVPPCRKPPSSTICVSHLAAPFVKLSYLIKMLTAFKDLYSVQKIHKIHTSHFYQRLFFSYTNLICFL